MGRGGVGEGEGEGGWIKTRSHKYRLNMIDDAYNVSFLV